MGSLSPSKLPVIDFCQENLRRGTSSWLSTRQDVLHALEEYGCFVAVYDKVPLQLHNALFASLEELFNLPVETKSKNVSPIPFTGYMAKLDDALYEGMGIANATDLEQIQDFTNTMWPNGHDQFCQTLLSFTKLVWELERMVVSMVLESYGLDNQYQESDEQWTPYYLWRMMKYRGHKEEEGNVGCNAHTDKYFITVLHQNQVNGLEIKTKDGQWIGFESSPSSFVVLAGEALLAWSNDRIHAPLHRVTMHGRETRYSVGLFSGPKGVIEVPEQLVDGEHPIRFKPFDIFGLLRYFTTEEGQKQACTIKGYCGI